MSDREKLERTLDAVASAAAMLQEPRWIIGSTAAYLVGLEEQPADVDLLTSEADACRLLEHWRLKAAPPDPSALFCSSLFTVARFAPLPIELMAGLKVRDEPLIPKTRLAVPWSKALLHVPEPVEQISILERFGRDKDLRRAARLKAHLGSL